MFIIVPLILIVFSLVGIAVIIWRKLPYLRKLSPELNEGSGNLFYEFFPEVVDTVRNFNYEEYKDTWLTELEKVLRRLRLVSLKIDNFSAGLIKKVRSVNSDRPEGAGGETEVLSGDESGVPEDKLENATGGLSEIKEDPAEAMKKEEQRLIMEVAKNPKDAELYILLAELYNKMGSYNEAGESYEAAMKLRPDDEKLKILHSKTLEKITRN